MANKHKVALATAGILASWHAVWSVLVATGAGQTIYDFILWAHMIHLPVTIGPFEATAAGTLIIVTAIIGYVAGYSGAMIWNAAHRQG